MIEFNLQFDVNEQLEDDAREFTEKLQAAIAQFLAQEYPEIQGVELEQVF